MRILFISRWFPYPPDNGARIRVFSLIKHLSRKHDVELLAFTDGDISSTQSEVMEQYCRRIHTTPYQEFRPNRLRALLGLFSTRPRSMVDTHSRGMRALVETVTADQPFDIVLASEIESVPYALLLHGTPMVFEELELAVIFEQFARQRSWVKRVRYGLTWWKQRHYVRYLLRHVDGCTVVSDPERALLHRVAPDFRPVEIVPNGVSLERYEGDWGAPVNDTLIFHGAMTYWANFEAMEYFLTTVFPLILAERPDVVLRITGRTDGVPLNRLALSKSVVLTGYLEHIEPAVAQSWGCVVPLLAGGGTRLKILEAMALGTPVVSTSKGAEGLEVIDGESILLADEPAEFAGAVVRLLGDESLRARLACSGRSLVQERYGWDRIGDRLDTFLQRVVERQREAQVR
ncbi:MAG: glycosyltransferase [Chloroflexi bacterium]|nr:glycosyltransferase [Chloroflexota bacterium]